MYRQVCTLPYIDWLTQVLSYADRAQFRKSATLRLHRLSTMSVLYHIPPLYGQPVQMSSKSHLPRRMAMHALQLKASEAGDTGGREKSGRLESCSESRHIPYDRIREVLARRQRAWDKRLAAAKCKKAPVVPQVRYDSEDSVTHAPTSYDLAHHSVER